MPRVEQIKVHKTPLYSEGSPVFITASALLVDRSSARNFAQVKMTNTDSREISAVLIDVLPFTPTGEAGVKIKHYYQGLSAKADEDFGQKEAIALGNSACSDFSVAVLKVEFENGEVWNAAASCKWEALPTKSEIAPSDDAAEYQLVVGNQATWTPYRFKDLWLCSCGHYNKSDLTTCHHCHSERDLVLLASSREELHPAAKKWREERIAAEQKKQEIAKADIERRAREAADRKRKRDKAVAITVAVACVAAVTYFTTTNVVMPALAYSNAEKALASQDYEAAWEGFSDLQDYRDAAKQAKAAAALKGDELLEANDYQEAAKWYELAESSESAEEAMYLYSEAHLTWSDETTYSYLSKLKDLRYKDAVSLYNDLYDWKFSFSIVTTNEPRVSVAYSASGGAPTDRNLIVHYHVYIKRNNEWKQYDTQMSDYTSEVAPGPETTGSTFISSFKYIHPDAIRITAYSDMLVKNLGTEELSLQQ